MTAELEICCFNLRSVLIAQEAGADRIELCAAPGEGGTSPSFGLIKSAREKLQIALYPIIRPRGGDFLYDHAEFDIMLHDIDLCRQLGCDGVVIGLLLQDGNIDKARTARLVSRAYPMGVTFHRAFDWAIHPQQALEELVDIGCERLLTSGQQPAATDGAGLLTELVIQANNRITIMPGAGIRSGNIAALAEQTKAGAFHTSARIAWNSTMQYVNRHMTESTDTVIADEKEIRKIKQVLQQLSESVAPEQETQ